MMIIYHHPSNLKKDKNMTVIDKWFGIGADGFMIPGRFVLGALIVVVSILTLAGYGVYSLVS